MAGTESVGTADSGKPGQPGMSRDAEDRTRQPHDVVAEVVSVSVDEKWMDETGRFHLEKADPIVYSHGTYYGLGEAIGTFGYSVAKKKKKKR